MCKVHKIEINNKNVIKNINILVNAYKKEKNIQIINFIKYLFEIYFYDREKTKDNYPQSVIDNNRSVLTNINEMFIYNLNKKIILDKISAKIND